MGRFSSASSYGHGIRPISGMDCFEIFWTVDHYYTGSRLRFPRQSRRITDEAGALRFCKKWEIPFPKGKNKL